MPPFGTADQGTSRGSLYYFGNLVPYELVAPQEGVAWRDDDDFVPNCHLETVIGLLAVSGIRVGGSSRARP